MLEFFKGWRRKAGCVTLVLALLSMMAWIRSRIEFDQFNYYTTSSMHKLFATEGRIGLFLYRGQTNSNFTYSLSVEPEDQKLYVGLSIGETHSQVIQRWQFGGFHFETGQTGNQLRYAVYAIPFWSITIPLTLLSAYLILWKPRPKPTQPESVPRISNQDTTDQLPRPFVSFVAFCSMASCSLLLYDLRSG